MFTKISKKIQYRYFFLQCMKGFSEINPIFKVAMFSSKDYDKKFFKAYSLKEVEVTFFKTQLNLSTVKLAEDHHAVCAFVHDDLSSEVLHILSKDLGINKIAMRCAGFNNIDLEKARSLNMQISRVPEYSPYAVAEHAACLALALNRRIKQSVDRVREGNFELDGLLGFDIHGKTVGVIGTGKIGTCFINIMKGFGAEILCYDSYPNKDLVSDPSVKYVELEEIFKRSDIISIHSILNSNTFHIIDKISIEKMKHGVMIINVSRGPIINTKDVIEGLKSKKIGYLGIDVVEQEEEVFFQDLSDSMIANDDIARLLMFNNVIITGHQAFFTQEALINISKTTIDNLYKMLKNLPCDNNVL